jgi:dCTP deaminase
VIRSSRLLQLLADPSSGLDVTPLVDLAQVGEGHIDLRLGPDVIVSRRVVGAAALDPVDPVAFKRAIDERHAYVRRSLGDSFHLQPGEFAIARSLEYVSLPEDLSAQVLSRSSWGRLGLTVATATLVQPGFGGTITLELANVSNTPIVLNIGTRVAQLSFAADCRHEPSAPSEADCRDLLARNRRRRGHSGGRYLAQLKPELSRIERDRDLAWIAPPPVGYIVGVVGLRFTGAMRVADFFGSRRGFRLYRFMHLLRDEAQARGSDPEDQAVLRRIGDELRAGHGKAYLAVKLWERIRSDLLAADRFREPPRIVVEGFKLPEELYALGHLAAFRPLVVRCAPRLRAESAWSDRRTLTAPRIPRPPSDRSRRDAWLRRYVDRADEDRRAHAAAVRLAERWDQTIVVDNSKGWEHTAAQLDRARGELDALWRAGRLEPEPCLVNAFAGNVPRP